MNIELLSISNPVHKKVCGLIIFVSFIRCYLNFIVYEDTDKGKAK